MATALNADYHLNQNLYHSRPHCYLHFESLKVKGTLEQRKGDRKMLTGPITERRSDATTAYELMADIRAYILEEPKRIFMGDWIIKGKQNIEDTFDTEAPACGTVGCIAGNAVLLTGVGTAGNVESRALNLLAGDDYGLEDGLGRLFHNIWVDAKYGTKEYAEIVAQRISAFQEKHKAALRRVKIEAA